MRRFALLPLLLLAACARTPSAGFGNVSSLASSSVAASSDSAPPELPRGICDPARVTKKPFGIRIDPKTSPVQPERFSGYHAGADFEVRDGEDPHALPVSALCDGTVLLARRVSGYGGVLVQSCTLGGEALTILYGHLDAASLPSVGAALRLGDAVGHLGKGFSAETDGERPHLHLSVHRGAAVELKGYVPSAAELGAWRDPLAFLSF